MDWQVPPLPGFLGCQVLVQSACQSLIFMNKAESYCYVNRNQLKPYNNNRKARICLCYSNQHPNPKERIEVKKSGDLQKDLQTLLKLVQDELPARKKVKIEKEKESLIYNTSKTIIEKYFICVQ